MDKYKYDESNRITVFKIDFAFATLFADILCASFEMGCTHNKGRTFSDTCQALFYNEEDLDYKAAVIQVFLT